LSYIYTKELIIIYQYKKIEMKFISLIGCEIKLN
jgi:hypothetical protein